MNWIKFEIGTSDKLEVWRIADILGIDPDAVIGKLLRIWAWFDQQTVDGNAVSVTTTSTIALLDRKVGVSGFCVAMIQVGWMREETDRLTLPNFDRHNGKTAKNRALTAKRVANHKLTSNAEVTRTALPREEKTTEEKSNNKKNTKKKTEEWVKPDGVDGEVEVEQSGASQGSSEKPLGTGGHITKNPGEATGETPKEKKTYSDEFEKFWLVFPGQRKTKKKDAYTRWKQAIKEVSVEVLIARASEYATSHVGQSEFAVMPSVWLNAGMWEDAPEAWGPKESHDKPVKQKIMDLEVLKLDASGRPA